MSVIAMLTLSIIQKLHTKSVDCFWGYIQADVKSEIYMEITLCFWFDESLSREEIKSIDKNLFGLKDYGLLWFV